MTNISMEARFIHFLEINHCLQGMDFYLSISIL